jgi:hypothetical protein
VNALLQNGFIGTRQHLAERFAELESCGVNYTRLTFSDAAQQTYIAEQVLPHLSGARQAVAAS